MPTEADFQKWERTVDARLKAAALEATDRQARVGLTNLRADMQAAGLGRLGNAINAGSDKRKSGNVRTVGAADWRAIAWVRVRGRSERTQGAIESYTQGATIVPKRGRWLWYPTAAVPARSGRKKMTPALYEAAGSRAGKLKFIPDPSNPRQAFLILENVTVGSEARTRGPGYARSLPRRGSIGKNRTKRAFVVAFVGIRSTRRDRRVAPLPIFEMAAAAVPNVMRDILSKG